MRVPGRTVSLVRSADFPGHACSTKAPVVSGAQAFLLDKGWIDPHFGPDLVVRCRDPVA